MHLPNCLAFSLSLLLATHGLHGARASFQEDDGDFAAGIALKSHDPALNNGHASIQRINSNFFESYRAEVSQHLNPDLVFRLPINLHLLGQLGQKPTHSEIQVIHSLWGRGLMVNLRVCPKTRATEVDCIVGHFSTAMLQSTTVQQELNDHQMVGYPITLAPGIQAHLREYRYGQTTYVSVMWVQDHQFYQVQFPAEERQNMLYMTLEMVNSEPLTSSGITASPPVTRKDLRVLQIENNSLILENAGGDLTAVAPSSLPSSNSLVDIAALKIGSSSLFTKQGIRNLLAQFQAKEPNITLAGMAERLTQEYLNRGYITSRVLTEGNRGIVFKEGFLNEIEVKGTASVDEGYIRSRLDQVGGRPLNIDLLEEKLRLLRLDPLFTNVEATLRRADTKVGEQGGIDLVVRVTEAPPLVYGLSINNDSAPTIGAEQFELRFTHLNVTGVGDRASASYSRSFAGGLSYLDLGYQVPLSPTDTMLRFSSSFINTTVTESPFDELGVKGNTNRYGVWLRQPLIRRPQQEFALSLGFTHAAGQTFLFDRLPTPFGFGPDADGFSRTSVISFAQDYVFREPSGAWALSSQFNLGTNLFNATQNPSPIPDSQFFSWQGLAQRVQRIGNDHLLVAQFNVQLTPDGLLPSESFTIGGVNSVRGYRQGARSGDNGLRFSLEDRITIHRDGAARPVVIVAPFFDLGYVWNHPDNPNIISGSSFLMGSGLGLLLQNIKGLNGFTFRLNYGLPLINTSDRGNNLQDSGFYFNINYNSAPNQ